MMRFFFQAEDGIRDKLVTGVQTCALPISGIPTALQEQNAFPGLATRWLARRARQVHLGFPEAREPLPVGSRTAVFALGNPILVPEPGSRHAAPLGVRVLPTRTTLLVFLGKHGARA